MLDNIRFNEISYFKVKPLLKLEITAPSRRSVTKDGESTLRILAGLRKVTMKIQDWIQFSQNILTFPGTRTLWQGAGSPGLTISITFSLNNTRNKSLYQKWKFHQKKKVALLFLSHLFHASLSFAPPSLPPATAALHLHHLTLHRVHLPVPPHHLSVSYLLFSRPSILGLVHLHSNITTPPCFLYCWGESSASSGKGDIFRQISNHYLLFSVAPCRGVRKRSLVHFS